MERWNDLRFRLLEWRVRRGNRAAAWLAARIPRSWRYWILIDSVAKVTIAHPKLDPSTIGAMDLCGFFEPELPTFHEHPLKRLWAGR